MSDLQQFQNAGIYTGIEPNLIGFNELNSLSNDFNIEITKSTNNIGQLKTGVSGCELETNLYIFLGQSNVEGRVLVGLLPPELQGVQSKVFEFDGASNFVAYDPTKLPNGNPKTYASFIPYLMNKLKTYHNDNVYFSQTYLSGSQLEPGGIPYPSYPTAQALNETQAAINKLVADGKTVNVNVIWVHGYTDALELAMANNYQTNLTNWFSSLRTITGVDNIHYNLLNINASPPFVSTIRTAQNNLAGGNNILYNFDTYGFDGAHYTQEGNVQISDAFFNELIKDLRVSSSQSSTTFDTIFEIGDRFIFNQVEYESTTGIATSTTPDLDKVNFKDVEQYLIDNKVIPLIIALG